MNIDPNYIDIELERMMGDQTFGFTMGKLDGIQQVKNIAAILVRDYAPNVIPPQTGWIWVDTAGSKSYVSMATTAITDWALLGNVGGSVANGKVAVGASGGALTSYTAFGYTNATGVMSVPIVDVSTELRQGGTKVVGARQAAIADASGGTTVDTEARAAINALLAACRTHGLIAV